MEIRRSRAEEQPRLFEIWRDAVQATHLFLSDEDFLFYAGLVRDEMLPTGEFWVATDETDRPVGFLQLVGTKVEALFVDPSLHRTGIGRALIEHARELSPTLQLDVSEQSLEGLAFYRSLGFRQMGRSPVDGAGRPYPLLHMEL